MTAALVDLLFFLLLTIGLGAALAPDWSLKKTERLCLGIAGAQILLYLAGFGVFVAGLDIAWLWTVPPATLAIMLWRRREIAALCGDPEIKSMLGLWGVFALWTLGLLALVVSYSGGGWAGDWLEHYHRALVFMQRESLHARFLGVYTLTARPPLANVVTALFMTFPGGRFADYQIFTALLGTLFFFPCWLFFQRWKNSTGPAAWLPLVLMLNPLVAENTTFAWTKLACTFWVLTGSYFLLRGVLNELGRRERIAGFLCLTAGLLTHYSAGPWVLVWLCAYGLWWFRRRRQTLSLGELGACILVCGLLAFTWFGWAGHTFGWQETSMSNSSASGWKTQTPGERLLIPLENIVDTIIPHPFRTMNQGLIDQLSRAGWIRDYFFNIYQTNLLLAAGFSGLFVILFASLRPKPGATPVVPAEKRLWLWFCPVVITLGIAVVAQPDKWGLAHVCLQPLVILGLAWVASRLPDLDAAARRIFVVLLSWDAAIGIALPFFIEARTYHALHGAPIRDQGFDVIRLNYSAMINYRTKTSQGLVFFADTLGRTAFLAVPMLLALLVLVIVRIRRQSQRRIAASPHAD